MVGETLSKEQADRVNVIFDELLEMRDYGIGQDDKDGWDYLTKILKAIDEDKLDRF